MSEREFAAVLLDMVPDYKLRYVTAYLQGLTADEPTDDAFCLGMYQSYQNDPDKGDFVPLSEALNECGVSLNEL